MEKDREGEYVVRLFQGVYFYAERSLTCGKKTFEDAVAQWKRRGFIVHIVRQPPTQES